jgi:type I restriction enzyme S subunit
MGRSAVRFDLEEVCHVQTGLSKSEKRTGEFVRRPYLRVANVQDGYLDLSEMKYIDVPAAQVHRFELKSGDVLLTEGGDYDKLGRGYLWKDNISGCVHQNHIFAVRVTKPELVIPEYLSYAIQSPHAKRYFLSCAKQTTNLASINSTQLKRLPLLLPSLSNQRNIISILSDWDTAIRTLRDLLTAKEKKYKGLMKRLLTFDSNPIRLRDFSTRVERRNSKGDGIPLTVSGRDGLISQLEFYDRRIAPDSADHYTLLHRGEFAYNRSYSAGYPYGAIKRLERYDEGIVSSLCLCFALRSSGPVISDYFASFCEMGGFNRQIHMIAQEGARNHGLLNVLATDFFNMTMPVPPLDWQARIVQVLNVGKREMELLAQQSRTTRMQKNGLLQMLFEFKPQTEGEGRES